jgi:DNA-binding transcriptional LysR family regulator
MVFDRVYDCHSFLQAANEMGLTQPSVTKIIHELEQFLDGPLFIRTNRGVVPTELGVLLGGRVKSIISELRFLTDELNAYRHGNTGHVIVGTLISAAARLLPKAIALLSKEHPGVYLTIREGMTSTLFPALAAGEVDIVVGRIPEQEVISSLQTSISHSVLFQEVFCPVVRVNHKLAAQNEIKVSELLEYDWILPPSGSPARTAAEALFKDSGCSLPKHYIESLSILTNIGLLMDTEMIALLPRDATLQFSQAGLISALDLSANSPFGDVGYSVRADKELTPACERLIKCLMQASTDPACHHLDLQ